MIIQLNSLEFPLSCICIFTCVFTELPYIEHVNNTGLEYHCPEMMAGRTADLTFQVMTPGALVVIRFVLIWVHLLLELPHTLCRFDCPKEAKELTSCSFSKYSYDREKKMG